MMSSRAKQTIGSILGGMALLALFFSPSAIFPPGRSTVHASIGHALASETLKLLNGTGKVTILARDTDAFAQPAMDAALKAFQGDLTKAGKGIRSLERIQMDPIRPAEVPS